MKIMIVIFDLRSSDLMIPRLVHLLVWWRMLDLLRAGLYIKIDALFLFIRDASHLDFVARSVTPNRMYKN
jgi:hypothetical protein